MIERIIISGYRCFSHLDMAPDPGLNIIVGDNESGKSTLLEAISLGLTGRINGRWMGDELNPYWFNTALLREFFAAVDQGEKPPPPQISIELYFTDDDLLQPLRGVHNSKGMDCPGVRVNIEPSSEYAAELAAYCNEPGRPNIIPVEYYDAAWHTFEDGRLIRRPRTVGVSMIPGQAPEVMGWYTFLLRHWIRPYLPLLFAGRRLTGLNFEGDPGRFAKDSQRFLDSEGRAYRKHLAALAVQVADRAGNAVIDRLSRIYPEVYLDEVQDLTGRDLDILERIMDSTIMLTMVGDLRQSVYDTNPHDPRHKQYRGLKMLQWFQAKQDEGKLVITQAARTWRSNQQIANFADRIFEDGLFAPTESTQDEITGHDGVFVVAKTDLGSYLDRYEPLCLHASTATKVDLDPARSIQNFGKVKGLTAKRVLIFPTQPIRAFLANGTRLADKPACGLYVAVTRARHSVAFVVDNARGIELPVWTPAGETRDSLTTGVRSPQAVPALV